MEICPKSFRQKWTFVKSIPGTDFINQFWTEVANLLTGKDERKAISFHGFGEPINLRILPIILKFILVCRYWLKLLPSI
jgi:hypothetical protein